MAVSRPGLTLRIETQAGALAEVFEASIPKIADYRTPAPGRISLWDLMGRSWRSSRRWMWQTQGASTGTPWPYYDQTAEADWYRWYKAGVYRRLLSVFDVLRWERGERLRPSMVQRTHPEYIQREGRADLVLGTAVPYARNHDLGIGRAPERMGGHAIPRRPLLAFGGQLRKSWRTDLTGWASAWGAELGEQLTAAEARGLRFAR